MRKYFQYLLKVTSLGFQRFVVNRKNLAIIILFEILDTIAFIFFLEILYGNFNLIAGYTKYELYFMYGLNLCQVKLMMVLCIGGIDSFSSKIVSRDFDLVLLKPINTRLAMMIPEINLQQIISMQAAVYLVVYGFCHSNITINWTLAIAIIEFLLSIVLLIDFFAIIMPIAFWTISASSLNDFAFSLQTNAKQPKEIYPKIVRIILTYIFPIILITNPTFMTLFNKPQWKEYFVLELVCFLIFEIVKRVIWKKGIRRYQCTVL